MTKKRVVLVLDFYKVHYLKQTAQGVINNYWATETGVELWKDMFNAIPNGSNLDMGEDVEFFIEFAYDAIPDIVRENKRPEFHKYKALNNTQVKESGERLIERLNAYDPDIVVPMGGWGCKVLLGANSITKLRGKPERVKLGNINPWVLATFSTDAVRVNMRNKPLQTIDLELLMRFLAEGDTAFEASSTAYTTLTNQDYDKAVAMFQTAMTHGKTPEDAVAWDFETNTLRAEALGSRILTVSLSWEHGQGVTIPIDHPRQQWTPEQKEHLMKLLFEFISSDVYKVGANIQFDMRFAKFHHKDGYLKAVRNLDIQAGYYIAISQEELDSKGLKTLAFYYTDMGGYDEPVSGFEKFFKSIVKELAKRHRNREKKPELWEEYQTQGFASLGISQPPYVNDEDLAETLSVIETLASEQGTYDIVNAIDGENYSYEWIPYRILTEYASGDADVTLRIHKRLYEEEIKKYHKWVDLYLNHYPKLMNTLAEIEYNGMQVDRNRLIEIRDAFEKKRQDIYAELQSHEIVKQLREVKESLYMEGLEEKAKKPADRDKAIYAQYTKYRKPESRELKITSPYDKGMLLYGLTGYMLEPNRQTLKDSAFTNMKDGLLKPADVMWSDFQTGEANVELLMEEHPDFTLGKVLLEFSKAEKLVTTYTQSILDKTDDNDVLHGRLVSTRTETSIEGVA